MKKKKEESLDEQLCKLIPSENVKFYLNSYKYLVRVNNNSILEFPHKEFKNVIDSLNTLVNRGWMNTEKRELIKKNY
jgi:hypothetical protein